MVSRLNFLYGICRFADEPSIMRYVKIAATLRDKTVRDVALRCRWMEVSSSLVRMPLFFRLEIAMS